MKSKCEIDKYGTKRWRNEQGELHREDGPAVEWVSGIKHWWFNGLLHREDGPAIEDINGEKYWYINGILHRKDGPAIERPGNQKYWWYHGEYIEVSSQKEFERLLRLKLFW